jgi:serine/threonine-protein kinase
MTSLICPQCGATLKTAADLAGRRVRCPKCRHGWTPFPAATAPASAESGPPNSLGGFEIVRLLGRGGFGDVYEARDTLLGRSVAVKVLARTFGTDAARLAAFLSEARAAAALRHPNVVAIYQVGREAAVTFIVMELIRGGSCSDWLKTKGPMSEAQATWIVSESARGLAAAHARGVVHRDIKPANLMLDDQGRVKVADFGLALRVDRPEQHDADGTIVGTPNFMSPEQFEGAAVDGRTDIYSLGATYFNLLTGRPPFVAETTTQLLAKHIIEPPPDPRTLRADLPEGCFRVIRTAMAKRPDDRYPNAEAMIADLGRI